VTIDPETDRLINRPEVSLLHAGLGIASSRAVAFTAKSTAEIPVVVETDAEEE